MPDDNYVLVAGHVKKIRFQMIGNNPGLTLTWNLISSPCLTLCGLAPIVA